MANDKPDDTAPHSNAVEEPSVAKLVAVGIGVVLYVSWKWIMYPESLSRGFWVGWGALLIGVALWAIITRARRA